MAMTHDYDLNTLRTFPGKEKMSPFPHRIKLDNVALSRGASVAQHPGSEDLMWPAWPLWGTLVWEGRPPSRDAPGQLWAIEIHSPNEVLQLGFFLV